MKYSVLSKLYVVLFDRWSSEKLIKFQICHRKSFFVADVTLSDQFIKFLVKLLTSNELVSLFMATIIKILSDTGEMQNIMMYFST